MINTAANRADVDIISQKQQLRVTSAMYDDIYRRRRKPCILDEIDLAASEDDTAKCLDCNGFLRRTELQSTFRFLRAHVPILKMSPRLLDLGCGTGGVGRWLSRSLHIGLIGIDFSPEAVAQANSRRGGVDAEFRVADFRETGLPDSSIAAAISVDALYLADDPAAALCELHRVLVPHGPLVFTGYTEEDTRDQPQHSHCQDSPSFWPRLLAEAGFEFHDCHDVTGPWRRYMHRKHTRRWAKRTRIIDELGELGKAELSVSQAMIGLNGQTSFLESTRRFELFAKRDG